MPLTQEKRLDSNFSNNNDHSYLHKKFKKMASTISVFPGTNSKGDESRYKEENVGKTAYDSSISNGSIAAAHPEIEKIKDRQVVNRHNVDNVQINFNEIRNSDVNNVQQSGQTSFTDEFSNKTENLENDFIRDAYNGTTAGRYICPYCKLSCAKPSVLQKHIRAHTNERPYPCVPCGFAFKTKSNLYKHRRSRTHALRLQGADVPAAGNDEDLSGDSESDTSIPPTSISDTGSEPSIIRLEVARPNEFSSPELTNDSIISINNSSSNDNIKPKTIYKPKFRAALYQENDDKDKLRKSISQNADFLTEHISKIISDNEAIVDVIDTPLQKKYGKIKQIAESKQFLLDNAVEIKREQSPLNLTKNCSETDNLFRKRSHSESFTQLDYHKHPLNPEGSIIKDLLLKTKGNGIVPVPNEDGPSFICPLCQIPYRSIENLEVHKTYYCKGYVSNNIITLNHTPKDVKILRPENIYVRSNSVNVRLPETPTTPFSKLSKSPPLKLKPDNLVIAKSETYEVTAPLPSPGPLLGNTRLVDTRTPDLNRKAENLKINRPMASPKRRLDSRSDTYSPRSIENVSPRSADLYVQPKIRCIEANSVTLRSLEENSPHMRHNSTSLQMFGGEVKIIDHMGSTTTLRIEPSKNQLSPILIQQNLSPSKIVNDAEASSIVVRSGLHSGGTMVHNPPTPKEVIATPQPKTPRIALQMSTASGVCVIPSMRDITHFQFPPLSAITAYNPLTLPPLSPSSSPSGTSTILHGGKLIPHVPGMPGPNTSSIIMASSKSQVKNMAPGDCKPQTDTAIQNSRAVIKTVRSPARSLELEKSIIYQEHKAETNQYTSVPIIKIKNVDEPNLVQNLYSVNVNKAAVSRQDVSIKRSADGSSKITILKENTNYITHKVKTTEKTSILAKTAESKSDSEICNYNFENMITKAEIYNNLIPNSSEIQKNTNTQETPPVSAQNERSETSYFQKNVIKSVAEERKPRFLRPSTLPLKPGTFTPKRHHGITPNANTMPLVSPETPRPAKAYGQLYLNGNAYTYLGLKCSTKVFYCTINRPQPTYVPNQHFLSMYSNWQLLSELTPDPLGLSASSAMSLYDSRHRPQNMSVAVIKQDLTLTHSSQCNKNNKDNKQMTPSFDAKSEDCKLQTSENVPRKELTGGFESNEEYTYVRGRGRGRYVCSECGIRCKKPSMLKKHIRTHTDVRPYTCIHCAFSFKTKGNLTKHMKSKAHYKKCCELGINPNEGNDDGGELAQSGETDDETDSDADEGNEGETESSDTEVCKSRLPEHEAAHCLLSLGGARPGAVATPGLLTSARPTTYPYTPPTPALDQGLSKDQDNEPMDLSKSDLKFTSNVTEIPTARESSVLASLASNTAKLPQHHSQWTNGEPLLHTYLTERALLDTKIKQSQLTINQSKIRKIDTEKQMFDKKDAEFDNVSITNTSLKLTVSVTTSSPHQQKISTTSTVTSESDITKKLSLQKDDYVTVSSESINVNVEPKNIRSSSSNAENAKHVVSEYLKQARINLIKSQEDSGPMQTDGFKEETYKGGEDKSNDECNLSDSDSVKPPGLDHDPVARKVVIGVGGVAFKVTKGKDFDNSSYPSGRLMEDGRRVCDFCNKSFTKPSQLRLHLNIHYMERPFRCSVCAVSFRTRGHLQKHERSGSHHNKVSMTSTFGAATSFNPRPFRCSDCNIAFRIHGHLAKHLRSKMHVMRLECLFKLPFGTFTEIERAGVSLTDIDTTDCASSLASLQSLARKLHEKDPSKLEYREVDLQDGDHDSDDAASAPHRATAAVIATGVHDDTESGDCSEATDKDTIHYSATDN